jgi:hypothetical protein
LRHCQNWLLDDIRTSGVALLKRRLSDDPADIANDGSNVMVWTGDDLRVHPAELACLIMTADQFTAVIEAVLAIADDRGLSHEEQIKVLEELIEAMREALT